MIEEFIISFLMTQDVYFELEQSFLLWNIKPTKAFACKCVAIIRTIYESGVLALRGERYSRAQK